MHGDNYYCKYLIVCLKSSLEHILYVMGVLFYVSLSQGMFNAVRNTFSMICYTSRCSYSTQDQLFRLLMAVMTLINIL